MNRNHHNTLQHFILALVIISQAMIPSVSGLSYMRARLSIYSIKSWPAGSMVECLTTILLTG